MRRPRVVVVGSANMDLVVTTSTLPAPGETVFGTEFNQVPGGKGANQAIAATRAGAEAVLLGAIGSDSFGVTLKARIAASGVDASRLRVVYGASGVALVTVDAAGENTIVVTPGANATLTALTGDELAAVRAAEVLVAQLEIPIEAVTVAAVAARAAGARVVLNATPARPVPADLLAAVDLLVVSVPEARAVLAGAARPAPEPSAEPADAEPADAEPADAEPADAEPADAEPADAEPADAEPADAEPGGVRATAVGAGWDQPVDLLTALLTVVPRVVLTLGPEGAWYADRDLVGPVHVPPVRVAVVDSTAAGDAFTAALAVAWGEDRDLVDAVRWASAAAAACAQKLGASVALPHRAEIEELYLG
nr:ribokinase [Micromonospora sp. DSM 115978]